ncbi:hypothetical protein GCM10009775_06190 [Microbacterium aoyamense]|uniref:Flagellar biosynthesis protein FlhA n=1 Tax=Microbacterium aoyamense TaxID=344166 RepID=A0ABP5ALG3_9MICO|nr:hypothetical protein [Microbacterium aoyamense]
MTKNSVWTILGVIVAIVIAWVLVNALFSLLWFIGKLVVVAVVAVLVFLALRGLFARSGDES